MTDRERLGSGIPGLSWADWPEGLSSYALQVVDRIEAGKPADALSLLDEMIDDLTARRLTVADLANAED